jgi:DNA-directed RNA polymerase subunit RPC12/RpoP
MTCVDCSRTIWSLGWNRCRDCADRLLYAAVLARMDRYFRRVPPLETERPAPAQPSELELRYAWGDR